MNGDLPQITIHLSRLGKPERSYTEGLVDDDGIRLKTFSIVPEAVSLRMSERFQGQGRISQHHRIYSVCKYHFYGEFFSIVEYRDETNKVLGYYCDIVTPLQRNGGEYLLTDLILDLWITPDHRYLELDRDEFTSAIAEGLISAELQTQASLTMERIKSEIAKRIFPGGYLGKKISLHSSARFISRFRAT